MFKRLLTARFYLFTVLIAGLNTQACGQEFAWWQPAGITQQTFQEVQFVETAVAPLPYRVPGERMLKAGRTLTLLGGAMFIGGIIVYSSADKSCYYDAYGYLICNDEKVYLGALMLVAGTGMLIPGIILWTKGAKKYKAYNEQLQGHVGLNSVSLSYRF